MKKDVSQDNFWISCSQNAKNESYSKFNAEQYFALPNATLTGSSKTDEQTDVPVYFKQDLTVANAATSSTNDEIHVTRKTWSC